jgi:hypothetical protein
MINEKKKLERAAQEALKYIYVDCRPWRGIRGLRLANSLSKHPLFYPLPSFVLSFTSPPNLSPINILYSLLHHPL